MCAAHARTHNFITLLVVGHYSTILYRVKLQDSRRQDKLSYSQVIALIQNGVLDLDDHIAPSGTDDWMHVWELQDAFEACVVKAYRHHEESIRRMRRSIAGNWLTVMEFRDQRDTLLAHEPGVNDSAWIARPRPDFINDVTGHELHAAAAIGAAREVETTTHTSGHDAQHAGASAETFRENIAKILKGDLPEWANPHALLMCAKTNTFKVFCIATFLTIATDPFRPWISLEWLVAFSGAYAIYAALRQLASVGVGRMWVDRFVVFILFTFILTLLFIATLKLEPQPRAGVLSRFPQVAALQEQLRTPRNT